MWRHCNFLNRIFFAFSFICFTDSWHCRIHFNWMGIDGSIDCVATDATWNLFVHWIVCAHWCGNTHIDHCIPGLLRRAQRVPMHAGYGECFHWNFSLLSWAQCGNSHQENMITNAGFCLIFQFFCFLLVVLVAEIATGVYAYQYRDKLNQLVQSHVKETVQKDYNVSDTKTAIFDVFQTNVSAQLAILSYDF